MQLLAQLTLMVCLLGNRQYSHAVVPLSAAQLMFTEEPSNASVEVGTPHALRYVVEMIM